MQKLPTIGRENVTPEARVRFMEMIAQREQQGIETYGTTLQTFNGRNVFQDLLEELVDAWQYAVQAQMETQSGAKHMEKLEKLVYAVVIFNLDYGEKLPVYMRDSWKKVVDALEGTEKEKK